MKTRICAAFLFIVMVTGSSFGQTPDTVTIPNDGLMGTINAAIQGDTTSLGEPAHPYRVYRLVRGGYYVLKGPLTTKAGTHVIIIGDTASSSGSDPGPAVIIEGEISGESYAYNLDCFGDLTMMHVRLMYMTTQGNRYWTILGFEEDSLHGVFEDVIFEGAMGICVGVWGKDFNCTFNNCIFRNDIDPSQWWAGRQICTVNAIATIDSISCENNTFENMGFVMQSDYTPIRHVWYNHNTYLNIAKFAFKQIYSGDLVCINNIFVNCIFSGETGADIMNDPDYRDPWGSTLRIDSLPSGVSYGVAEPDRRCIFKNNSNFTDPGFQQFYDAYNKTATDPNLKIVSEPMLSPHTLSMFATYPHFRLGALYDSTDPHFTTPATNMDSIIAFLQARYSAGGNVFWGYKPASSAAPEWPLPEALSYSNITLLSAGMGGFPLGDLYHWFPEKYRAWKDYMKTNGGEIDAVARKDPKTPEVFFLGQNYPNPFNPTTTINYDLKVSGLVTLKVYDVLGREVRMLVNERQAAGSHSILFDGSNLPSGIYLYRLQAGSYTNVMKMILLK